MKKVFISMVIFVFIISVMSINTYATPNSNFCFRKVIGAPESSYDMVKSIVVSGTDRIKVSVSQITYGAKLVVSYDNSNKPIILDSVGTYYIILPAYSNTITVNIKTVFEAPSGYIVGNVSS